MDVQIIPAAIEHVTSLHHALDAVAREGEYLTRRQAPPMDSVHCFVAQLLEQGHPQFVAVAGPEVVGWCDIRGTADPNKMGLGVLGIGLLAPYRGRGLGNRLLGGTLEAARRCRFAGVALLVRKSNKRAITLYQKFGFQFVEDRDGTNNDLFRMAMTF